MVSENWAQRKGRLPTVLPSTKIYCQSFAFDPEKGSHTFLSLLAHSLSIPWRTLPKTTSGESDFNSLYGVNRAKKNLTSCLKMFNDSCVTARGLGRIGKMELGGDIEYRKRESVSR